MEIKCWVVWDRDWQKTATDVADRPCWYRLKRHAIQELKYHKKPQCEVRQATLTIAHGKGEG
jgi:hypothetical protein